MLLNSIPRELDSVVAKLKAGAEVSLAELKLADPSELSAFVFMRDMPATDVLGDLEPWVAERLGIRDPVLNANPFSHSLDGAVWRYARKAVASMAKSMGFLEAAGLGDAMGKWLSDHLKRPPVRAVCVGVGFGFPKDAPKGAWSRFAVIYYDRWQRAARPDLAIWPDLGEDENEDELVRFGLRYMVEEIGL
jgi:hypothetical protein